MKLGFASEVMILRVPCPLSVLLQPGTLAAHRPRPLLSPGSPCAFEGGLAVSPPQGLALWEGSHSHTSADRGCVLFGRLVPSASSGLPVCSHCFLPQPSCAHGTAACTLTCARASVRGSSPFPSPQCQLLGGHRNRTPGWGGPIPQVLAARMQWKAEGPRFCLSVCGLRAVDFP